MKHIKRIKIDIDKKNFKVITSVQFDNARFLHINLVNGAVPFNLTGCSVKISGTKPDGTAIFNNCTVINAKEGFIEVELTEQMNAVPGIIKCELKLYAGSGVLTTKHFDIDVTASVTSKNVTSGNEFKALEEALSKVNNIDTKFESLTEAAVKAATEKEIQKQIALGNMANLTIADYSIAGIKIEDETITKDKLDPYIQFGVENLSDNVIIPTLTNNTKARVNLFDNNKGEPGYLVATTGLVKLSSMGSNDWTSDFIACIPGETITKDDKSSNAVNNQDVCFYNANKTYISGIVLKKDEHWKTFKIPEGAYYFRFDMWASHKDTEKIYANRGSGGSSNENNDNITGYILSDEIKVKGENLIDLNVGINQISESIITTEIIPSDEDEEGIESYEYSLNENIKVKNENLSDLQVSLNQLGDDIITRSSTLTNNTKAKVNLFDKNKGEPGYLVATTGLVKLSSMGSNDWTSDFIACIPGETITKDNNSSNAVNNQDVCFYNADRIYLSGIVLKKDEHWKTFKVPEGAYYFRFDMWASHKDTEKIYANRGSGGSGNEDNTSVENVLSDSIKIRKSNIIGMEDDNSTKEQISLYNEDGIEFLLTIDSAGELNIRRAKQEIPSGMNKFTTIGKSCVGGDILVTPHTEDANLGWLIVLDSNLNLKNYKQISSFAYNFRKHKNKAGETRYIYCQTVDKEYPKMPNNGGYNNVKLVVADKTFKVLREHYLKAHGTVHDRHPGENHEVIYFDDDHYLMSAYVKGVVSNIPGKPGTYKALNCVIQEVKDGKVVFHWESIDHPELYQYACRNKDFTNYPNTQAIHNDYFHLNSVQVDPLNSNHLLVSARFLGLMKIDKSTGNIIWMFGRGGRIDFKNMTEAQAPYLQHHITRVYDGSIICFDNSGCATNNTRICRYWLDEETMTMTKFKEYKTNHPRSAHMGSVDMIRDGVFLINYGGKYAGVTFEEYDFNLNKQNFSFRFNDGTDCYRVFKDI